MTTPTKADLAAAVAKLSAENAELRDLLAAVSECADAVPIQKNSSGDRKREARFVHVLSHIKVLSNVDDSWPGCIAYAAKVLRACAAEPVGYEVYADDEYRITDKGIAAADAEMASAS